MYKIITGRDPQTTLKGSVRIVGKSIYSGEDCAAVILPAEENNGIKFRLDRIEIPANYHYIKAEVDAYTTVLQKDNIKIKTVEHLLSALWGTGIDNAIIKLEKGEIPFLDASVELYCMLLGKVGQQKQSAKRKYLKIQEEKTFRYAKEPDRYAVFKPANKLSIDATSLFNNIIGKQQFSHVWSPKTYIKEISWARSFLNSPIDNRSDKWENIRKKIKLLPKDPKLSPLIVYTKDEFITPLKAPNECVRHKILDFYGDISLLGIRLKADVLLYKPGHEFTRQIVVEIAKEMEKEICRKERTF